VSAALDVLSALLLLSGCALALVTAVGLHAVPDAYARLHVQTKATTLAIILTMSGAMLQMPGLSDVVKLVLVVVLQLWTTPIASHVLGRAARGAGLEPARPLDVDEQPASHVAPPPHDTSTDS
jgi:multicomponent Na+:H+ antiporter subunit G